MKRVGRFGAFWAVTLGLMVWMAAPEGLRAQEGGGGTPSGTAPAGLRSRLTLRGDFESDVFLQKNFLLGAESADSVSKSATGYNTRWIQNLELYPRVILADNLNLNLDLSLAHGDWALDKSTQDQETPGLSDLFNSRTDYLHLRFYWAYLAYRNARTKTRWYIGRQKFGLGNLLVLDMDGDGVQVYRDIKGSSLGLGYAKVLEGASSRGYAVPDTATRAQGADLGYAEWRYGGEQRSLFLNPFLLWYADRAAGDSTKSSYLPDEAGSLDARFEPNISRATVFGLAGHLGRSLARLDFEGDMLSGKDRIKNENSGLLELHDVNNGTLKGTNIFGRLRVDLAKLTIGGVLLMGSGDDSLFSGNGNFNSLKNQGHFSVTQIWGHGLALDERGLMPEGLSNPYSRGYRGLDNTRLFQGNAAYRVRQNLRLFASYSIIRAAKALHPWKDLNGDGRITPGLVPGTPDSLLDTEYGRDYGLVAYGSGKKAPRGASTALGSEMDATLEWTVDQNVILTLDAGMFNPEDAAGYLINGTAKYQKKVTQIRFGLRIPIPEFSLGG